MTAMMPAGRRATDDRQDHRRGPGRANGRVDATRWFMERQTNTVTGRAQGIAMQGLSIAVNTPGRRASKIGAIRTSPGVAAPAMAAILHRGGHVSVP